jgi:hypothetical protein
MLSNQTFCLIALWCTVALAIVVYTFRVAWYNALELVVEEIPRRWLDLRLFFWDHLAGGCGILSSRFSKMARGASSRWITLAEERGDIPTLDQMKRDIEDIPF